MQAAAKKKRKRDQILLSQSMWKCQKVIILNSEVAVKNQLFFVFVTLLCDAVECGYNLLSTIDQSRPKKSPYVCVCASAKFFCA